MIAFGAEAGDRGVEQHLVQVGAVDRNVRPLVAGGHPPRLAVDELAVAGEERVVLRLAGDRDERVLQPQRAQLLDRVRPEIDADAERVDFRRRLVDADAPRCAGRMQAERQRQSADAAADDDDVRIRIHSWSALSPSSCRAKAGHPRLSCNKTWMAGTSPAMTSGIQRLTWQGDRRAGNAERKVIEARRAIDDSPAPVTPSRGGTHRCCPMPIARRPPIS